MVMHHPHNQATYVLTKLLSKALRTELSVYIVFQASPFPEYIVHITLKPDDYCITIPLPHHIEEQSDKIIDFINNEISTNYPELFI